jgi:hypothetical protein
MASTAHTDVLTAYEGVEELSSFSTEELAEYRAGLLDLETVRFTCGDALAQRYLVGLARPVPVRTWLSRARCSSLR